MARLADAYNFFHPVQDQTGNQFQWWNCLFNTRVTVDADSKTITPGLADTWEASADATTYTFHLHPGVKWHDGVAFTAQDVIYSATFFAQDGAERAEAQWRLSANQLRPKLPNLADLMDQAEPDSLP